MLDGGIREDRVKNRRQLLFELLLNPWNYLTVAYYSETISLVEINQILLDPCLHFPAPQNGSHLIESQPISVLFDEAV